MGISVLRGVGWVPRKCWLQRPQHKSTPDPVAAPGPKKCCTFAGLELAPKSRRNNWQAACTKVPNAFNPSGTIRKNSFCPKAQKGAICAILKEKTPFLAFPEAKKGVVHCARLRKAAHWPNNNANPSGLSQKKFIV